MNIYFAGGCFWGTEHYISQFMGVTVPEVRRVAKRFRNCSFDLLEALLESEWHECRLCALLILREKYAKSPDEAVTFYLTHTDGINNWDLVDLSAPYILGTYLLEREDRQVLYHDHASHYAEVLNRKIIIGSP